MSLQVILGNAVSGVITVLTIILVLAYVALACVVFYNALESASRTSSGLLFRFISLVIAAVGAILWPLVALLTFLFGKGSEEEA